MTLQPWIRRLLALAFLSSSLLAASAFAGDAGCEPAKVAQKYPMLAGKTVRIGADPQTPPYVYRDAGDFSKVIGVDVELAKAVMDCAGVKYEYVLGAWSGLLPAVQSGQIDVMWDDLYYKPERAKVVDFATYMTAATGALVAVGNPRQIAGLASLCGLTASFAIGSSNEGVTKKQSDACVAAGKPAVNLMPFQDLAAGLRLLESGRTDVIMWDLGFVDNLATTQKQKFSRAFAIMDGYLIGAAVGKNRPELLQLIHDGLNAVQASGEQKKIFARYGLDAGLISPTMLKKE